MKKIKGIIFDYGGTIDTPSVHWSEVLWSGYQQAGICIEKEQFRQAYVYGERAMAREPLVRPEHTFLDVLRIKVEQEFVSLRIEQLIPFTDEQVSDYVQKVSCWCYDYVLRNLEVSRPVIECLAEKYPLVLVSNFYGNINTILKDFGLADFFQAIVESSVVGVRKPDPRIYQLGVDALALSASEVLVVGDSFSKDVVPAKSIGCCVAWFRGIGWGDEQIDESLPDTIITSLPQLLGLLG